MNKTRLEYVYAQPDPSGGMTWALGPEDFEMVRQGYACGHCLEVFSIGGGLVSLTVCPTCKRPTTLMGIDEVLTDTPQDWIDYERHRNEELEKPIAPARKRPT